MRILNLFAGLGGNRTRWKATVTAIERDPIIAGLYLKRFPSDQVIIADVYEYLRDRNNDLDRYILAWFSPPCQTHSQMQKFYHSETLRAPPPPM